MSFRINRLDKNLTNFEFFEPRIVKNFHKMSIVFVTSFKNVRRTMTHNVTEGKKLYKRKNFIFIPFARFFLNLHGDDCAV